MTDLAPFPATDALVLELLADLVPANHVGTVTPDNLSTMLPFIRVTIHGGSDDGITDSARVDVDYMAATFAAARAGAEAVRQRLSTLRGPHVLPDGVIDRVATLTRPQEVPWADNGEIRRFTQSHTVDTRRYATT